MGFHKNHIDRWIFLNKFVYNYSTNNLHFVTANGRQSNVKLKSVKSGQPHN